MKLHPDKNSQGAERFLDLQKAYQSLINPETRKKTEFAAEKEKKNEEQSEKVKKYREDLIARENTPKDLPKKRSYKEKPSELPKPSFFGIKACWNTKNVYLEEIIHKIFEEYGNIEKINIKDQKAFVIFSNAMAIVTSK